MEDNATKSYAIAKYQRVSPRKTRLVARNVVGFDVDKAMDLYDGSIDDFYRKRLEKGI